MEKRASKKTFKQVFLTKNSEETRKLGKKFASELTDGALICLYGELGSGKTTFVQGLAKGLGVAQRIISPTFVIVRQYAILRYSIHFYHIDLYRIESQQGLKGLGFDEILNDSSNIVVIEWAERLGHLLPKKRWDITFEYVDEGRKITVDARRN